MSPNKSFCVVEPPHNAIGSGGDDDDDDLVALEFLTFLFSVQPCILILAHLVHLHSRSYFTTSEHHTCLVITPPTSPAINLPASVLQFSGAERKHMKAVA